MILEFSDQKSFEQAKQLLEKAGIPFQISANSSESFFKSEIDFWWESYEEGLEVSLSSIEREQLIQETSDILETYEWIPSEEEIKNETLSQLQSLIEGRA